MDSRKYSMHMLFFPIPGDVFEAEIIDFVFYVSHRD